MAPRPCSPRVAGCCRATCRPASSPKSWAWTARTEFHGLDRALAEPGTAGPSGVNAVQTEFGRIQRLPPYVFNIIGELKQQARARGEDIIDFGMGNPDQATPPLIVDKLIETVQRGARPCATSTRVIHLSRT